MYLYLALLATCVTAAFSAPLDDYVYTPDPEYKWEYVSNITGEGFTAHTLNLTSQRWGHAPFQFIERGYQVWSHFLTIVVPDARTSDTLGVLYIDGGNWRRTEPDLGGKEMRLMTEVALTTGVISCFVENVPHQPVVWSIDPSAGEVTEDELIAIGWAAFLADESAPGEFLARFPMTKAAVRAMDAVTEFVSQEIDENVVLKEWAIAGKSKRGWTSWTVAAVDPRVVAAIPIVMDMLGVNDLIKHMFRMFDGSYTYQFNDYWSRNITAKVDSPRIKEMLDLVDPISFLDRYTMPIYVITTTGDQFFMPDNSRSWSHLFRLPGKQLFHRMYPNCEHGMSNCWDQMISDVAAFVSSIVDDGRSRLPKFRSMISRDFSKDGTRIYVLPMQSPILSAKLWSGLSPDTGLKDFRMNRVNGTEVILTPEALEWKSVDLQPDQSCKYTAVVDAPNDGRWRAAFVELEFAGASKYIDTLKRQQPSQVFTTETSIVPQTFPAETCFGSGCRGASLV